MNHHILSIADLIPDLDIMKRDAYPFKHLIPKKIPHCDPVKESTPKWDEKENLFTRGPPQDQERNAMENITAKHEHMIQ